MTWALSSFSLSLSFFPSPLLSNSPNFVVINVPQGVCPPAVRSPAGPGRVRVPAPLGRRGLCPQGSPQDLATLPAWQDPTIQMCPGCCLALVPLYGVKGLQWGHHSGCDPVGEVRVEELKLGFLVPPHGQSYSPARQGCLRRTPRSLEPPVPLTHRAGGHGPQRGFIQAQPDLLSSWTHSALLMGSRAGARGGGGGNRERRRRRSGW